MNYQKENFILHTKKLMGLLVLFVCLASISVNAQEVISGKIISESGEALIGVTVVILCFVNLSNIVYIKAV